jgi:uncharacterized protein (DUF342 family)
MDRLKKTLLDAEESPQVDDKVVVVGLSIATCLNRAAEYFNRDLTMLDYEILERGKRSLFSKTPYRIMVSLLPASSAYADLEEFSMKIGAGDRLLSDELERFVEPKHRDGSVAVRIYLSGVFIVVQPAVGNGRPATVEDCTRRLEQRGIQSYNMRHIEQAIKDQSGEMIKVAEFQPRPEHDSNCRVEITPDEMKAYVTITAPKKGGRDLQVGDIVSALKAHGVVIGFKEDEIAAALNEDRYMQDILAAEGVPAKHGRDAYIDFKVKVKREMELREDEQGKVDFKELHLVENVVVGQILAEKMPAEKGTAGKSLFNRILPARDGKDVDLKPGKNTILSQDGMKLSAEINGQVVLSGTRLSVEPIYRVAGDVGPKSGNVMFLGSVHVGGSVLDNYEVKAAGNVEVRGSVQKAKIEGEGDIIIQSGIMGRDEAVVESTGGSVIAKFIQSAKILAAQDITVQESILHSHVEAGNEIVCSGRRAQIVGGVIRATKEVRARIIGSQAYTATQITVGTDPRILHQYEDLTRMVTETDTELKEKQREKSTLETRQKNDPETFGAEQVRRLKEAAEAIGTLTEKSKELKAEKEKLETYMEEMASEGKVVVEKEIFPGVIINIRNASYEVTERLTGVVFSYHEGHIKIGKPDRPGAGRRR